MKQFSAFPMLPAQPAAPAGHGLSRRSLLAGAAILPAALLTPTAADAGSSTRLVMRDGWVLRADDLRRPGAA